MLDSYIFQMCMDGPMNSRNFASSSWCIQLMAAAGMALEKVAMHLEIFLCGSHMN